MTKKYDYNNQIILEDCLVGLRKLEDESADIIIIDPPYNIGKDFGNNKDNLPITEYVSWCKEWFKECYRILKPHGIGYIYGFSEILAYISTSIPLEKQRWLIWHYTNKVIPSLKFWQRSHEAIVCFWKDKPHFNVDEVRVPYTENFLKNSAGKKRTSTKCRFNKDPNYVSYYTPNKNGALPKDVFEISTLAGGKALQERYFYCLSCQNFCHPKERHSHEKCEIILHPTQKPMELTKKLIIASRPQKINYNVLIPFCGSGSECFVTQELKGNFLAFEINANYKLLAEHMLTIKKRYRFFSISFCLPF